jgi:hypothetical protein
MDYHEIALLSEKSRSDVRILDAFLWFQHSEESFNAGRH